MKIGSFVALCDQYRSNSKSKSNFILNFVPGDIKTFLSIDTIVLILFKDFLFGFNN